MNRPSLEVPSRQLVGTGQFRLRTLGVMRLDAIGAPSTSPPSLLLGPSKPLALIVYLALSPGYSASRRQVADLLWGGGSVSDPARGLRQALSLIKRDTSSPLVQADGDLVTLRQDMLGCDAWDFTRALERRDFAEAVKCYDGNFIENFATPGARAFEEWCNIERARLLTRFLQAAETVARTELDAGHARQALAIARIVRHHAPHSLMGWGLLIEATLAAGDTVGARAEGAQLEEYLRREGLDPDADIAALLRMARKDPSPGAADVPVFRFELVGREREFATLMQGSVEAARDRLIVIHVEGMPGMGKSRLADDFIARLRGAGRARTAFIKAHAGEHRVPFSLVSTLAGSLARLPGAAGVSPASQSALLRLNPSLSAVYTASQQDLAHDEGFRLRAGVALVELVETIVDRAPLVIAIDDLHWCDDASREVLSSLFARLDNQSVLVVTTGRPGSTLPALPANARQLVLGPLDERQVEALVTGLATLPETPWATAFPRMLCRAGRGIPFYVIEALRHCIDEGWVGIEAGTWRCARPADLDALLGPNTFVAGRLRGLGDAARVVLQRLAIAGAPLPHELLFDGNDASADQSLAVDLERVGLLTRRGDAWDVAHDEIASAVLADIGAGQGLAIRAWLGDRMKRSVDIAWREQAFRHLALAGDWQGAGELARVLLDDSRNTDEDRRRLQDLTGEPPGSHRLEQLYAGLPWAFRHRRGLRLSFVISAVGLAAAAVTAYVVTRPEPAAPDAMLSIWTPSSAGGMTPDIADIRSGAWVPERSIRFRTPPARPDTAAINQFLVAGPDGLWARAVDGSESESLEIELGDAHSHRRILSSASDDVPYGFSPDGRYLAFGSSRWNALGHKNIGLFDLRTNSIAWRLTANDDVDDSHILWHSDGSRIVFMRKFFNRDGNAACVVGFDGTGERCFTPPDMVIEGMLGLLGNTSLLVRASWHGITTEFVVGIDSAFVERAPGMPAAIASIDPSGRWALSEANAAAGRPYPQVVPYGQWDRGRRIEVPPGPVSPQLIWMPDPNPRFLDRIVRRDNIRRLALGVPFRISWSGLAADSTPVPLPPLQSKSLRPDVASVDSMGVVIPRRPGVAVIQTSARGWRAHTDTFVVAPDTPRVVFTERWTGDWRERWRAFGQPSPTVTTAIGNKPVFLNNGDGNYESGAYLRRRLLQQRGLAVQFEVSTPVTAIQWQRMNLSLRQGLGAEVMKEWDHVTAGLPVAAGGNCQFTYPAGEGIGGVTQMSPGGRIAVLPFDTQRRMPNGGWYDVTVQLLPDGRCGIAVDGIPVDLRSDWNATADSETVLVYGASRGTNLLVGEVRIIEGVAPGIDWRSLPYDGTAWRRPIGPALPGVAKLIRPTKPMSFIGAGK